MYELFPSEQERREKLRLELLGIYQKLAQREDLTNGDLVMFRSIHQRIQSTPELKKKLYLGETVKLFQKLKESPEPLTTKALLVKNFYTKLFGEMQ